MEMSILDFSLCAIENTIIFLFFNKLFKKRFQALQILIVAIFLATLFSFMFSGLNTIFKAVLGFINIFVISSILYKDPSIIKAGYSLMLLYILSVIDIIFGNLISILADQTFLSVFYSSVFLRLSVCLIIKAFDGLFIFLVYKMFKKIQYDIQPKFWVLYNAVILVFLLITVSFIELYSQKQQEAESSFLFLIISFSFFAMSMVVIYFFTEICSGFQRDKKLYILESGYDALKERMAFQSQSSEKIKKIYHDVNRHLTNVCTLIENGKHESAVELLYKAIGDMDKTSPQISVASGNDIVDAIIASKSVLAESKQIHFEYYTEPLNEIKVEVLDLSSLISNVLDNAFDAAEESSSAFVKLKIFKYNAYWTIYVENSYLGGLVLKRTVQCPISTKPNKFQHGYGSQIIKEVALKYNGEVTWEADGEAFKTIVLIKL